MAIIFPAAVWSAKITPATDHTERVPPLRSRLLSIVTNLSCFRVIVVNAQSVVNKIADLRILLTKYQYDAVFVTESWLTDVHNDTEFMINHYQLLRKDRARKKRGGGILLYVRDVYAVHVAEQLTRLASLENASFESLWCTISERSTNASGQSSNGVYSAVSIVHQATATQVLTNWLHMWTMLVTCTQSTR